MFQKQVCYMLQKQVCHNVLTRLSQGCKNLVSKLAAILYNLDLLVWLTIAKGTQIMIHIHILCTYVAKYIATMHMM